MIKKFLDTLENDTIVSIGTGDGSGYLYIDENDYTKICKVFDNYLLAQKRRLTADRNRLRSLIMSPPKLTGDDIEEDYKTINKHADEIAKCVSMIRSRKKYIKNYKKLEDRHIKDSYDRTDEDGIAIIIQGDENGKLWWRRDNK